MPHPDPWPAPRAAGPITAEVVLPGSKSQTNRLLVLAALAEGRSVVRRPLHSRDTELMVAGLRVLGVAVSEGPDDGWVIESTAGPLHPTGTAVDVGNAGTVARFLPPVAALATGPVRFDGDPRVRERPVGPLLAALRSLGVELDRVAGLPVTVRGSGRVAGGSVVVDAGPSSQIVSGLLLSAPRFAGGLHLRHEGGELPSGAHLAMTVLALRGAGAEVDDSEPGRWAVAPGGLRAQDVRVEPDLSTAAAYLAAPLVAGGRVSVAGWPQRCAQPGAVLPDLLAGMGARVTRSPEGLTVAAGERLVGLDADLRDAGELTPVLTALACFADGPSRLRGIGHLRMHETDRLAALARELTALGGDVSELDDGLLVRPRPLHGGTVETYDDHRLAMAAAVVGLGVPGVLVRNVATTRKTVPDFPGSWTALLSGP